MKWPRSHSVHVAVLGLEPSLLASVFHVPFTLKGASPARLASPFRARVLSLSSFVDSLGGDGDQGWHLLVSVGCWRLRLWLEACWMWDIMSL